ncbi:MAG: L-histidine N(alpha)-methyltransferase [Gammaproteobacteria bacterium]|nr:L-histidine N(alpha)-methyltransferase [Gammaproteobacteria bacterium]MYF28752.1 L-histidine N(alpha)-methyltransferase [Gammaproteobacteria bacterium]MYK47699.1 L-histidine N(alpha)-methyltransferase [Gammaproteobacteria bacterium]
MAAEVLHGLSLPAKSIPPKYFYDAEGSRLFDVITKLPGYYLTRIETAILRDNRDLIAGRVGTGACLVEYGSGSSVKSRLLIEACRPAAYVPVDISRDHLEQSAQAVFDGYPELAVYPTCADYTTPFELPSPAATLPRLAFFPGSSIGNFEPAAAGAFLRGVAQVVDAGGWLVVGVDAKKDRDVLDRAYTDAAGITEQFNKNLLANINAAVGADFDLGGFRHLAVYNELAGRIEMYLVSQRDERVTVAGTEIDFAKGERLHTENSYKYAPDEFVAIAEQSGFECVDILTDELAYFMVLLLRAR